MTREYFYRLHLHHRPVNDLSTAVKLTNRLLRLWANGGFFSLQKSPQSVFSRLVPIPYNITSRFAIALAEIRTRRIFKRKGGMQAVVCFSFGLYFFGKQNKL